MWDRTGENQVYVRQQKAAEEQLRFDKTEKPSRLASKDNGGSVPLCPPRRCNLVGILLLDKTANVSPASILQRFLHRLSLTLDYTQGCTFEVPDAGCEEVNANRADVQTDGRKHRGHSF